MDRRAEALQQEFVDKARRVDSQYGGTAPGTVGPVEEKLLSFEYRGWYLGLLARQVSLSTGSLIKLLPVKSRWLVPSVAGKVL